MAPSDMRGGSFHGYCAAPAVRDSNFPEKRFCEASRNEGRAATGVGTRAPNRQNLLMLNPLEGLTTDEAARRLGCPRGTVLSRLAAARDKLRGRLARRGLG